MKTSLLRTLLIGASVLQALSACATSPERHAPPPLAAPPSVELTESL